MLIEIFSWRVSVMERIWTLLGIIKEGMMGYGRVR